MNKNTIITVLMLAVIGLAVITGCDNNRKPGKIYMPDMTYSRAIETYAPLDSFVFTDDFSSPGAKIFYNGKPVTGTIERGELFPYTLPNDTLGYQMSATVKNPLPPLAGKDSIESARLFNINCAICHGANGQANGPLATSGKVGGIANLAAAAYVAMADGTMYHSIHYGKNNMGSYASQMSRKQRWQMVQYIRTLQPKTDSATSTGASAKNSAVPATKTDTTATRTK